MSILPLFSRPMGGEGNNICERTRWHWARTVVSTIAIIGAVLFMAGCGGSPTANTTATPTSTVDTSATPTDTTTPTAAATSTTSAATPTPKPVQATNNTPATPAPAQRPTPRPAAPQPTQTPVPASSGKTVTVWVQLTDSCEQALPGGSVVVNGPGISNKILSVSGSGAVGLSTYQHTCPVQRGTCTQTSTGCASVALNVPASGTATYTITAAALGGSHYLPGIVFQPASPIQRNYAYVWCEGGPDCPHGPEVATIHVTSGGSVSATTQNIEPDGFRDASWPVGGSYTAAQGDPIMFHFFGASASNDFSMTCMNDGTHLLRDHMTGTPNWPHCNSGQ
jgi:hypothetical protein